MERVAGQLEAAAIMHERFTPARVASRTVHGRAWPQWKCMRLHYVSSALALVAVLSVDATLGAQARHRRSVKAPPPLQCGDLVGFQVLLDRQGFSPGQIDGKRGDNLSHALAAIQSARGLPASGEPDCATWEALGGAAATEPLIATYTVTSEDVKGPFQPIPPTAARQAALPALGYQSALEALAERFHTSPAVLAELNPGGAVVEEGREIRVPGVTPFDPDVKPTFDPAAADVTISVSRAESALRATRADGTLLFYAPVTTGSVHDPLPTGRYKVLGLRWHPDFHYNPRLFWDAKKGDEKSTIKPGPNNPVGIVWIALNLKHYGLHGTPEPGRVGHTESHGCVRLTNWDAARVASLVKPGTPVQFK
jgi:lipoprotein-anchoring transpeptidase ErfK/SrfK